MFIDKENFINNLCRDCKSKTYSMGFKWAKTCEDNCLTIKVLSKEKGV